MSAMTLVEQLARYLAHRLGLGFETEVFFGYMPETPARAIGVYASDLRPADDLEGTRVEVAVRSDLDGAWAMEQAVAIMRALDGLRDAMFTPEGSYIHRVEAEKGFEFTGVEGQNVQYYTARFRVYGCEEGCA